METGQAALWVVILLVVLAILLAILVPSMVGWIAKAKEKQVQVELRTVALAIQSAQAETYGEMGYAVQTSSSFSLALYSIGGGQSPIAHWQRSTQCEPHSSTPPPTKPPPFSK